MALVDLDKVNQMAVIKYKQIKNYEGTTAPEFLNRRDAAIGPYSSVDNTNIGWIPDRGEKYYIPKDQFTILTKQDYVDRQLEIHSKFPFLKPAPGYENIDPLETPEPVEILTQEKTIEEVISEAEEWYDNICTEKTQNYAITAEDLERLKKDKVKQAFEKLQEKLENAVIEVSISSKGANTTFGCDRVTEENILGVSTAIVANVSLPQPIKWASKGSTVPTTVTNQEILDIGAAILDKKNQYYQVYFNHKENILLLNTYDSIVRYDHSTGYE